MKPSRIDQIRQVASEWEFDKRIPAPRAARLLRELLHRVDELERGMGQMRLISGLPLPPEVVAKVAEADRLRKLFDDAGQGEHNMLALVEHYQSEMMKAQEQVSGIAAILGDAGCDCDDEDEDEDARYRCLAHRIQDVLQPEFRVRT